MKGIKLEYIAIAGLLIYILLLQECSSNLLGLSGNSNSGPDTLSHTTDTTYITRVDTIMLPQEVQYVTLEIPTPVYIHDTTFIGDSAVVSTHAEYTTDITDSLIEGKIISKVNGTLLSQELNYIPLFPKYITRVDSVIIESETVLEQKRTYLYLGGEVGGGSQQFNLSPMIGIGTKKGFMYGYRYGLLDKTHNISFSKKLSFKKK